MRGKFKRIKGLILATTIALFAPAIFIGTPIAIHALEVRCNDGTIQSTSIASIDAGNNPCANHDGYAREADPNAPQGSANTGSEDLDKLLKNAINVLAAAAMMVFIISFIFSGYQYLTARDNASQVAAAKERIITLVITFILFVFGFGLLQWLVPGGIFN